MINNKLKTRKSLIVAGVVVVGILGILAAKEARAAPMPYVISGAMFGHISIPVQPVSQPPVATFHSPIIGRVVAPPVNIGGIPEINAPITGRVVIPKNTPPVNISGPRGPGTHEFFYSPSINLPMFG